MRLVISDYIIHYMIRVRTQSEHCNAVLRTTKRSRPDASYQSVESVHPATHSETTIYIPLVSNRPCENQVYQVVQQYLNTV